jgi:hypothetical protein
MSVEMWELLSYIVTVIGLPFAIIVFMVEQRKERQNEEEETYQQLSDQYSDFCKLLLANSDLGLLSPLDPSLNLSAEQRERKYVMFEILVSLFERAYILVFDENMNRQSQRMWASWEDYIRTWCRREDFREALPQLLRGEDPDFTAYISSLAASEAGQPSVANG